VTEWSKGFDRVSVEEMAFDPRRAAAAAACMVAMTEAGLDWSFYYHLWDQTAYAEEFKPFFEKPQIMYRHWNEVPHRFGLFGVEGEVRPQYGVYRLLGMMEGRRLKVDPPEQDLWVLAGLQADVPSVLIANYGRPTSQDRVVTLKFSHLLPGRRKLSTLRIDREGAWRSATSVMPAAERREVDVEAEFSCQIYSPADSVALVRLEAIDAGRKP
jgi:hypothetical protein